VPPVYQLKITLIDIEPPIWRRIQVPATILLCCLHDALQAVFGWTDSHLHNFEKDGKYWGVPEYDDLIDESKITLAKLLRVEGDSMIYVYDFGDNWRHEVVLEKIISVRDLVKIPICVWRTPLSTRRRGRRIRLSELPGSHFRSDSRRLRTIRPLGRRSLRR
jgi:Plasmid pRiA4b ORF-3-like protein